MFTGETGTLFKDWLIDTCGKPVTERLDIRICISDYSKRVREYYTAEQSALNRLCTRPDFGPLIEAFGLEISFPDPTPIRIHDRNLVLDERLRTVMRAHGVIKLINAFPAEGREAVDQHNVFPNLRFHMDRGRDQPNQVSMFIRAHDNPDHFHPRTSQTLFVANAVAHLQALREGRAIADQRMANYEIFHALDVEALFDRIILAHPWQAPAGQGEIVLFDNRDLLHASYHPGPHGYRIGVRYLY